jgi:hypothetical protein
VGPFFGILGVWSPPFFVIFVPNARAKCLHAREIKESVC